MGRERGLAVAPIRSMREALDEEQFAFRGFLSGDTANKDVRSATVPWHLHELSSGATGTREWKVTGSAEEPSRLLQGLRVLDLSWIWSGPLTTSVLGDLGAEEHLDAAALRRARAVPAVLLAVEQAGVARGALDLALSHARERQQFGRAIGSFQALKHLLADMLVDVETARDVARYGVWSLTENADDPEELAAMTHAHVSDCAVRVASSALQVLGGIGYTWEHPGHLYYKRAVTSARLFTTVDRELDRLAVRIGIDGPS